MSAFVRQGLDWPVRRILRIYRDPLTGEEKAIVDWEASAVPLRDVDPQLIAAFRNNPQRPPHSSFTILVAALRRQDPGLPHKFVKYAEDEIRSRQEGIGRLRAFTNGNDDVELEWAAGRFSPENMRGHLKRFLHKMKMNKKLKVSVDRGTFKFIEI